MLLAALPPAPAIVRHCIPYPARRKREMRAARELRASLRLTRWLRCRFGIAVKNVIGHNESLTSPYHHERVVALRRQTHGDWVHASMVRYRARRRALPCPS